MNKEQTKTAVEALQRIRSKLLERKDDYLSAMKCSGHPAVYNRYAQIMEDIELVEAELGTLVAPKTGGNGEHK